MPRVKKISDDQVLDQALAVLLESGPHRVTLPEVGRVVGLSPSTLIQRFGSKRALMDRVLERATDQLRGALSAREPSGDARRDLLDLMASQARPLRTRAHIAGNLSLLIEDVTDEARRAIAQRHMAVMREGIAAHLRAMGSPSVEAHVGMIEAHWNGLGIQWAMQDEEIELEAWIKRGLGTLLDALLPVSRCAAQHDEITGLGGL